MWVMTLFHYLGWIPWPHQEIWSGVCPTWHIGCYYQKKRRGMLDLLKLKTEVIKAVFSFLLPELTHGTQLPFGEVDPLFFLYHVLTTGLVATTQVLAMTSSLPDLQEGSLMCLLNNPCYQTFILCPSLPHASSPWSYITMLPNILPPPHDSLLNSEDSLTIKNDYRDIKIKQSFAGRSLFSHLPTSNIK